MPNSNIDYESTLLLYFSVKRLITTLALLYSCSLRLFLAGTDNMYRLFIYLFFSLQLNILLFDYVFFRHIPFYILFTYQFYANNLFVIIRQKRSVNICQLLIYKFCLSFRSVMSVCLFVYLSVCLSVCLSVAVCVLLLLHAAPKTRRLYA